MRGYGKWNVAVWSGHRQGMDVYWLAHLARNSGVYVYARTNIANLIFNSCSSSESSYVYI